MVWRKHHLVPQLEMIGFRMAMLVSNYSTIVSLATLGKVLLYLEWELDNHCEP